MPHLLLLFLIRSFIVGLPGCEPRDPVEDLRLVASRFIVLHDPVIAFDPMVLRAMVGLHLGYC
jgi:hypothetical protein